ncbi:hypothetical protein Q3G72_028050 [Acer saccharum]|nr:hypothetical protein Q3G72_028050 [Acer saccharum]
MENKNAGGRDSQPGEEEYIGQRVRHALRTISLGISKSSKVLARNFMSYLRDDKMTHVMTLRIPLQSSHPT